MSVRGRLPVACTAFVCITLIAGCAGNRVVSRDAAIVDAAQDDRRTRISEIHEWRLQGRVAVSDGREGGSARIEWTQDDARAVIVLRAPVSGQTWRLSGDNTEGWLLEGTRPGGARGVDAAALLLRETGWNVPFEVLRNALFGIADGEGARIELRANGLPALLHAEGWRVEYVAYDEKLTPALPTRLRAARGEHSLRLAVSEWQID